MIWNWIRTEVTTMTDKQKRQSDPGYSFPNIPESWQGETRKFMLAIRDVFDTVFKRIKSSVESLVPFKGASETSPGEQGLVPKPGYGGESKFLKGNGSWEKALEPSDIANDLETVTEGMVLDARQGKELNDSIALLNDSVSLLNTAISTLQSLFATATYSKSNSSQQWVTFTVTGTGMVFLTACNTHKADDYNSSGVAEIQVSSNNSSYSELSRSGWRLNGSGTGGMTPETTCSIAWPVNNTTLYFRGRGSGSFDRNNFVLRLTAMGSLTVT